MPRHAKKMQSEGGSGSESDSVSFVVFGTFVFAVLAGMHPVAVGGAGAVLCYRRLVAADLVSTSVSLSRGSHRTVRVAAGPKHDTTKHPYPFFLSALVHTHIAAPPPKKRTPRKVRLPVFRGASFCRSHPRLPTPSFLPCPTPQVVVSAAPGPAGSKKAQGKPPPPPAAAAAKEAAPAAGAAAAAAAANGGSEGTNIEARFYAALYAKLLSSDLGGASNPVLFLNLVYKAIKADREAARAAAFAKRLLQASA